MDFDYIKKLAFKGGNNYKAEQDEFTSLKQEYAVFKQKISKSEFANSPVAFETELQMLENLKSIVLKYDLKSELDWISERQSELSKKLDKTVDNTPSSAFYQDINVKVNPNSNNIDLSLDSFENKNLVKNSIRKLYVAGISINSAVDIVKKLSVQSSDGKSLLNEDSVEGVVFLKKSLSSARNNELIEHQRPITNLNKVVLDLNDSYITFKDDKVSHISPKSSKSAYELKQDYNQAQSEVEDGIILEFINKYKQKDGSIDNNYLRVLTALKRAGVTNPHVLNMCDFCIDDKGLIDKNKLNLISILKQSGGIDDDLQTLIESIDVSPEGEYNPEDISSVEDLTKAVIGGKEVAQIVPVIRNKPELKEFACCLSPYFNDKSNIVRLVNSVIAENSDSTDINAIEIINNLASNLLNQESNKLNENTFVDSAINILQFCKNPHENFVNDEVAGICAIMCSNNEPIENIFHGLNICKNKDGIFDKKLSEILWDMSIQKADIKQISDVINSCKTDNGNINYQIADTVLALLDSGENIDRIISLLHN